MDIDSQIKKAQRELAKDEKSSEKAILLLRLLRRKGALNEDDESIIRLIATLEDPIGLAFYPNAKPVIGGYLTYLNSVDYIILPFSLYCAKKVLPIWENYKPEIQGPALAIEAAQRFNRNKNRDNAENALIVSEEADEEVGFNFNKAGDAASTAILTAKLCRYYLIDDYFAALQSRLADIQSVVRSASQALGDMTPTQLLVEFLTQGLRQKMWE